jgi:hypothetical protein
VPHSILPPDDPNHPYFQHLAALLEPDAIEYVRLGTFTYAVGSNETKYLLLGRELYFDPNTSARYDVRKPNEPLPLRGVTVKGSGSTACAIFLDPAAPVYADARRTYYERLNAIANLPSKTVYLATNPSTFLPGPYGSIVTSVLMFDGGDLGLAIAGHTANHFPIDYALGTSTTTRFQHYMTVPVTKAFVKGIRATVSSTSGITYVNLPSTWGVFADPLAPYDFRDDFMGASLDTTTIWSKAESTAGNVQIDSQFPWLKLVGNGSWGANGVFAQTGHARSGQPTFLADVFLSSTANPGMLGWHDGAGYSFTDMAHAVYFSGGSIYIFENGTSRGAVSTYATLQTYRVRIKALSGGGATYEIQGGTQFNPIGSATWTNITPGTTSSATNTLHPGAAVVDNATSLHIGDVRVY